MRPIENDDYLSPGFVRHHMKWSSWRRDSVENLALIRPVRTGTAGSAAARDGSENSAAVEKRHAPIEKSGVRTTQRWEHAVAAVAEQCGGVVDCEVNRIADTIRTHASC